MTEDDLKKFLDDNRESILKSARDNIIARISEGMKYQLPDTYAKVVAEFLEKEIAPEVGKILMGQRGAIIAAVTASAATIGDELSKKMTETALKALSGYNANEIFKKLMGTH